MKRFMVEGKFKAFKEVFKHKWTKIGDDELDSFLDINAEEEAVVHKLSEKYNKTKEEMKKELHEWFDKIEHIKDENINEIMDEIKDIEINIKK